MTVGCYLDAIRCFLERDGFQVLCRAIGRKTRRSCRLEDIEEIRIIQVKHGEFYHPARVEVWIGSRPVLFVINGAVSKPGRMTLEREGRILSMIRARYGVSFVPMVYRIGCVWDNQRHFPVKLFLGEWFEGFHEFHLSSRGDDQRATGVRVWDPDRAEAFLSPGQEHDLYREAAAILTICYNLETFEQIYPWHHAAGDFVVRTIGTDVAVRLVTVRQYASLIEPSAEAKPPEIKLEALLLFFVNMSLRMRLDRIDGTGETAWSGSAAVAGTVAGFFKGLAIQKTCRRICPSEANHIKTHLMSRSLDDFMEIAEMLLAAQPPGASDTPLMASGLASHMKDCYQALRING